MKEIDNNIKTTRNLSNMFEDWFLDYASYVILERAIPKIDDGLKPVQRRILHSMKEMHDSRYHKVANIIGNTMQYHPHGDQAIGDALVGLGQKDLLIKTQGNWGDPRTGDKSAAPRYIEARLSDFALDVVFNNNITSFQPSYDGRKNEPISLPCKFPLILFQGAEGIAVGLSTKILPHNFIEIIKCSIQYLNDKPFQIFPDFSTGGYIDVKNYNYGKKGSRLRVRCNIEVVDKETIRISNLPYGITTTNLIDSIVKANNNGKIKIKNIEDNTAQNVEIIIRLIKGVSPNVTIDALYAFTNCEISLSPNCCVIVNNKPEFLSINELLKISTDNTMNTLESELKYNLNKLEEQWHISNLEKIFIEYKVYRKIEDCTTWESVIDTISIELKPYHHMLNKKVSSDDILKLTELKIKKISKHNSLYHKQKIEKIESDIKIIKDNILNIRQYCIDFFNNLLKKYAPNKERKTLIKEFDSISARRVVVANQKLFINKKEGFIGLSLKKDEFISKCSTIDNIIIFLEDGRYIVTQIDHKKYIGKNIIHASVWKKNDKYMIYNLVYKDGLSKISYVKRFSIISLIKDRFYNITQGNENSKVLYFTENPNSESEVVNIYLHIKSKAKNKNFDYDFSSLNIKSRKAKGNILSKYPIRKISQKTLGESTLGGRDIWIDENIGRLNTDKRGLYLGSFNTDDKVLVFYNHGEYEMTSFDMANRYKMSEIGSIEKYDSNTVFTVLYKDGKSKTFFIKRFKVETQLLDRKFQYINDNRGTKLFLISNSSSLYVEYNFRLKNGEKKNKKVLVEDFVSIKGWKSIGNKLDNKMRMSAFKFIDNKIVRELVDIKLEDNELTLFK